MPTLPTGRYEIRTTFRVPLEFAFRWCTDYSAQDPTLEGSKSTRTVIRRSSRRVVYEDLEPLAKGWSWSRATVDLIPPDRWHAELHGNYRTWSLDYRLAPAGARRTEFHMVGRRRPVLLGSRNPSRASMERELTQMWRRFARTMEADYRKRRPRPSALRRRR